jgi:hypothetical protein
MMNSRVEKDFEDFIFSGKQMLIMEEALFLLLDKYKDQLIRGRLGMEEGTDLIIHECLEKIKLHENFKKNAKYFQINVKKYEEYGVDEGSGDKGSDKVA